MENDILDSLNDLGYNGPLLDEAAFAKALDGGPKSLEYTKLVHILADELKKRCQLEETVNMMNDPDESSSFLLELSSFLKELGCPYRKLVTGHMSSRLQTKEDRLLLLDYLISELMAARIIQVDKPKDNSAMKIIMHESPTAKDLKDILITLKFNKPPPNITPEMLFSKLEAKLKETIQKEGAQLVGKPLYNKSLSEKEWKQLEITFNEMYEEYRLRRETLITRLECTIQSFEWSDRLKNKKDVIQSTYRPKREQLKVKPDVHLSDFLAARSDLLQVEKTSSANVRKNTQSDVNKVIIGQVPDRGGRPNEQQPPPPEMPSWQQRSTGPQMKKIPKSKEIEITADQNKSAFEEKKLRIGKKQRRRLKKLAAREVLQAKRRRLAAAQNDGTECDFTDPTRGPCTNHDVLTVQNIDETETVAKRFQLLVSDYEEIELTTEQKKAIRNKRKINRMLRKQGGWIVFQNEAKRSKFEAEASTECLDVVPGASRDALVVQEARETEISTAGMTTDVKTMRKSMQIELTVDRNKPAPEKNQVITNRTVTWCKLKKCDGRERTVAIDTKSNSSAADTKTGTHCKSIDTEPILGPSTSHGLMQEMRETETSATNRLGPLLSDEEIALFANQINTGKLSKKRKRKLRRLVERQIAAKRRRLDAEASIGCVTVDIEQSPVPNNQGVLAIQDVKETEIAPVKSSDLPALHEEISNMAQNDTISSECTNQKPPDVEKVEQCIASVRELAVEAKTNVTDMDTAASNTQEKPLLTSLKRPKKSTSLPPPSLTKKRKKGQDRQNYLLNDPKKLPKKHRYVRLSKNLNGEEVKTKSKPKRPLSDSDKLQFHLRVIIVTVPHTKFSTAQAVQLRHAIDSKILETVLSPCSSNPKAPSFRGKCFLIKGGLSLWCEDSYALNWLEKTVPSMKSPIPGTTLAVVRESDMKRKNMLKARLIIHSRITDTATLHRLLCAQNPWYKAELWHCYNLKVHEPQNEGDSNVKLVHLILGIPKEQLHSIKERRCRVAHMTGSGYIQFITKRATTSANPAMAQESGPLPGPSTSDPQSSFKTESDCTFVNKGNISDDDVVLISP